MSEIEQNRFFAEHKSSGYRLSPTEAAGHHNFLLRAEPAEQALDLLLRSHPDDHFRQDELAILRQAAALLRASLVPMALFTVEQPKPVFKLHGRVRPPEK